MFGSWTFGRKVGLGFAAAALLTLVVGGIGLWALRSVVQQKDDVINVEAKRVERAQILHADAANAVSRVRGFLLSGDEVLLDQLATDREHFQSIIVEAKAVSTSAEGTAMLVEIEAAKNRFREIADREVAMRKAGASLEEISAVIRTDERPRMVDLEGKIDAYVARAERKVQDGRAEASSVASAAQTISFVVMAAALALCVVLAVWLTRSLTRQIGAAVQQVQSSSAELQAAATQQASGAREQSTALNEVTTTMKELLATSQQIAENAQRVAKIAEDTAGSAAAGDLTGRTAQDAIGGIKRQVDVIARHMLELGKRSQQIGTVLDIIGELAEQTNILAINATIEAAGAGEAGRRFAVVADEVRKLADRVGGSTKEIRTLIEEIRTATNTTVMATEDGAKAVDAGLRQFADVEGSFRKVAALAGTAMESAKEIGMSTRQQASAVEQVNGAIGDVAQAAKETEVSTRQTLDTVGQLLALSTDLAKIVRSSQARA